WMLKFFQCPAYLLRPGINDVQLQKIGVNQVHINVLYEDNHLLIVEKPVNVPVQGDSSKDKDLLTILKQYIKEKYNKAGDVYLGLVHRLDRPVGGAMVFARTSKAASRLSDELRKHQIYSKDLAVTRGAPQKQRWRSRTALRK